MKLCKTGTLVLSAALVFGTSSALTWAQTAGQDMKNAGHETKNATTDAGHGISKGTKKAYHKTKRGTKKAYHKTESGTKHTVHKIEGKPTTESPQ
ncbi:MAG TPA: hypothetical protein VFE38_11425 [Edaphobacter sp.]|nr:hypothetical protein [Edaphobacter sp.]